METHKETAKVVQVYDCALCSYSTQIKSYYQNHVKTHSSEKPFKCPECPFKARLQQYVNVHVKNVHLFGSTTESGSGPSRPFSCSHSGCNYAAKNQSLLDCHSKLHSADNPFLCSHPNCTFSSKHKTSLVFHSRIHTGEKPYVCQFESCSYASATPGSLVSHSRTHSKERPYKCPEGNCEYSSAQISALKAHQLTHEPKEGEERPSFSCPLCEYSGKSKGSLFKHAKRHTLEKFFKCDEPNCNYKSHKNWDLTVHKVVHSDEKPFACSFKSCEFRCKIKSSLTNHLKIHSEEKHYKCELCPFRGKQRGVVSNHLKIVHSDPDFRPFKCTEPECDSTFKTKAKLRSHLLFHKGEKKYSCSFPGCEYKAVLRDMVKKHEAAKHETEKRFKCELCPFATKTKRNLVGHSRTHTMEEPYFCKKEGCQYRAKTSTALRSHKQRNHFFTEAQ